MKRPREPPTKPGGTNGTVKKYICKVERRNEDDERGKTGSSGEHGRAIHGI